MGDRRLVLVKILWGAGAVLATWLVWPQLVFSHEVVNTTVTYDREIIRIVNKKCIACHSEHNLGIPLTSYEQTRPWARAIEEEVLRKHMPPWRAVGGYGHFANDIGLTSRETQFLVAWIEGNGPKTKNDRLIVNFDTQATPPNERLQPDFSRWQLGNPDQLVSIGRLSVPGMTTGQVETRTVDLGLTSDRWLKALEFKPGDRRVIRAASFSVAETGEWLGGWTPWYGITTLPDDTAKVLHAGAHVTATIYSSNSGSMTIEDHSALGLHFAGQPPTHLATNLVVNAAPDAKHDGTKVRFRGSTTLMAEATLLALYPEVHPGVDSLQVTARTPDGNIQILLFVQRALAEWPTPYILDAPIWLPKDTTLSFTSYYLASSANLPASATLTLSTSSPAQTKPSIP